MKKLYSIVISRLSNLFIRIKFSPKRSYKPLGFNYIGFFFLILLLLNITPVHAQLPTDFQKVELLTELTNSTTFKFAPDGRNKKSALFSPVSGVFQQNQMSSKKILSNNRKLYPQYKNLKNDS